MPMHSVTPVDQATRSELVAKYFLSVPIRPSFAPQVLTAAAGSAGIVAGYSLLTAPRLGSLVDGPAALVLLAGLVAVGAMAMHTAGKLVRHRAARRRALPKASGVDMDGWLDSAVRQATASAGGPPGSRPLVLVGIPDLVRFPWNQVAAGVDDGVLRFSLYEILVVHLLDHRLVTYAEVHDMRTGERRSPVITDYPIAAVGAFQLVVAPIGQVRGPSALGQVMDRKAFAATSEVSRVRLIQLSAHGKVALALTVGVATRRRGEPETIAPHLSPGGGLDQVLADLNERVIAARLRSAAYATP